MTKLQFLSTTLLVLSVILPGAAKACESAVFDQTYLCPDGNGGSYEMKLAKLQVGNSIVISVKDNEYDQEFVSDTSRYNTTSLGQTIGLCNRANFKVDIYAGADNQVVQSQIHITGGADYYYRGVRVNKFVRYPGQSAFDRSFVCTKI